MFLRNFVFSTLFCYLSTFSCTGVVIGRRYPSRVQTSVTQDSQMDHIALQSVQGGVGLDHPIAGHIHRHIYAVFRSFPIERTSLQRSSAAEVQLRGPVSGCRFFR